MTRQPARKLSILDGMILVAATAIGLALARWVISIEPSGSWHGYIQWLPPILLCWSAATLAIRLRPPRPSLRRVFRQPGAASLVMALVVFFLWSNLILLLYLKSGAFDLAFATVPTGSAVVASWAVQWLSGAFRPEPGVIDRLGRLLGLAWVIVMVLFLYDALAT